MKQFVTALVVCGVLAACTIRSERVVERPAPPPATATVVTTDVPRSTTTIVVPQ
jgi:hypothetical protein